jgi:hypothetical protein
VQPLLPVGMQVGAAAASTGAAGRTACLPKRGGTVDHGAAGQQLLPAPAAPAWPLLLLGRVCAVVDSAGSAGDAPAEEDDGGGRLVVLAVWPERAELADGPSLPCPAGPSATGCLPAGGASGGGGGGDDAATCMVATRCGLAVIGTRAGQVLVWDVVGGGLTGALDSSLAGGGPVRCVSVLPGPGDGSCRGGNADSGGGGAPPQPRVLSLAAGFGDTLLTCNLELAAEV